MVLGMQGLTRSDPRRYVLSVLNAALGGGSSSRLFQEVRERRGLAYSVYSFGLGYSDAGMVGVAAGSLPSKADDLLRVVRDELARVAESGLTEEEVERGKGQARGGLVLSLEDSGSRMTRLGEAELFQRRLRSVDEVLEHLDAVTVAGRPRPRRGAVHAAPDAGPGGPRALARRDRRSDALVRVGDSDQVERAAQPPSTTVRYARRCHSRGGGLVGECGASAPGGRNSNCPGAVTRICHGPEWMRRWWCPQSSSMLPSEVASAVDPVGDVVGVAHHGWPGAVGEAAVAGRGRPVPSRSRRWPGAC